MTTREEYLKRYLSSDVDYKKKKTKKRGSEKSAKQSRIKIIEDDVDIPVASNDPDIGTEVIDLESDDDDIKPIVALVNNDTEELRLLGKFNADSWKVLDDEKPTSSRCRHDSDDQSPIRRRESNDTSPKRRRHDSGDISPPRRRRDSDISPPRKRRHDSGDQSPLRRHSIKTEPQSPARKRHDSNDQSPPRRREESPDRSPPRRNQRRSRQDSQSSQRSPSTRWKRRLSPEIVEKSERTASGLKAGLQRAADLRQELVEAKGKEEEKLKNISEDVSGRGASTVYRKKMTLEKKKRKEPTEEQKKRAEEMEKKYAVWNKGQKQVQERKQKLDEMVAEASKPFARHRGDEDLEEHLKKIEYNDDPMLNYIREKRQKETGETSKPMYKGPWPPNRYNIPPGYRWDGIDRSTGFEVKLMESKNIKKAEEEEYYKWSTGRYE